MPVTGRPFPTPEDDAALQSKARALASPLRMRILRLCLHEARTNRELAEELGINPGTLLHHVRSLTTNGFLVAEAPRKGARGAREVPYRATGLSWAMPGMGAQQGPILLETFLQEIEGLNPGDLEITRLGLKLTREHRDEMLSRFNDLFQEYARRDPDPDGEPISLMFAEHPDLPRSKRATPR